MSRIALFFGFCFSTQKRKGAKDAKFFEIAREKCAKTKALCGRDITYKTLQKAFLCVLCAFASLRWIFPPTTHSTTP